jgi:2,3-bisphosphoglycerate-dependent phosphoglycerate mutase
MDRAILARHGESERSAGKRVNGDPRVPVGLTEAGREQARRLGETLRHVPLGLAITSAFPRAIETADVALAGRRVPRLVVPDLNDLVFGTFEDGALEEYRAWVRAHGPEEAPPGGGESRADSVRRWVRGYRQVLERPEPEVLVVAHGMPIRYVLAAIEGVPPSALAEEVGYAEPFPLTAAELARAVARLDDWCGAPAWAAAG